MEKEGVSITGRLVEFLSAGIMILGILYSIILLYKNVIDTREIKGTEVQIAAVLIATGLLGTVLKSIIRKHVRDYFESHQEVMSELIRSSVEIEKALEKEEGSQNEIDEYKNPIELNTVIVPIQRSYYDILKDNKYVCPNTYSFKEGLKYIAFYKNKEVIGYGKLENLDYNTSENGQKVFRFNSILPLEIPHKKKGAFVQNKMYCSIQNLTTAKETTDIRPDRF